MLAALSSNTEVIVAPLLAALLSLWVCGLVRAVAIRRGLLDRPNDRSLHSEPVPRIGGVGVFVAVYAGLTTAALARPASAWRHDMLVWALAGIPVFALGLFDDLRPLSAPIRFLVHLAIAVGFVWQLAPHGVIATEWGALSIPSWIFRFAAVVWIVAVLNVYNFMDGMDGLAGSQTFTAGIVLAALYLLCGVPDVAFPLLLISGAALGFLVHNAPPARIFMGDGCSTFLGYAFATLPLIAHQRRALSLLVAPAVLAPFLADGTFTIVRRVLAGEKFWRAHRTHLYQRAVSSGLAHRDVWIVYAAWLLVSATVTVLCAKDRPALGLLVAYIPLVPTYLWVRKRERAAVL
jgi:Fuc2NAc and GlcNAc transferase